MPLLPVERGAQPPDGEPPASTRVHLDSTCAGGLRAIRLWRSRRQYVFKNEEVLFLDMMIRVEIFAESRVGKPRYRMSWWPEHDTDFFERKPRYQRSEDGSDFVGPSASTQSCIS